MCRQRGTDPGAVQTSCVQEGYAGGGAGGCLHGVWGAAGGPNIEVCGVCPVYASSQGEKRIPSALTRPGAVRGSGLRGSAARGVGQLVG